MNRRERLDALLAGKPVDRPPVGFWLHFPKECHHGDAAVKAHLDFVRETDTDILKVMNENLLYDGVSKVRCTADLDLLRGFSRKDRIYRDQMEIIGRIAQEAKGDYPVLATIHGLLASVFHATGFSGHFVDMGYGLAVFCRENPRKMRDVFAMFTESLMEYVDCSLEAGADGIFYAALGGQAHWFTSEEYAEYVMPFEKQLYDHIKSRTPFDVLHICKAGVDLTRFAPLRPAIVNWSVYQNHISLTEGAAVFPESILLGGFPDRTGVLVTGSEDEIRAHTRAVLAEMQGRRFIVGSDCTLPTAIDPARIRLVARTVRELTGTE